MAKVCIMSTIEQCEAITRQRIRNLLTEYDSCNGYGATIIIAVGVFAMGFGLLGVFISVPMLVAGLYLAHVNSCRRRVIRGEVALLNLELPE